MDEQGPGPTLRLIRAVNVGRVLSHLGLCLPAYAGAGIQGVIGHKPNVSSSFLCFYDLMESHGRGPENACPQEGQFGWPTKDEQAFKMGHGHSRLEVTFAKVEVGKVLASRKEDWSMKLGNDGGEKGSHAS